MIAESAQMGVGYLQKLVDGISAEDFGRLPRAGDQTFQSNHPAFILGHLSLYPGRVIAELGGNAVPVQPSEKYEALFSPSATCLDDPDGSLYPPKDEIIETCLAAHNAAVETLRTADDASFAKPNPNERMRSRFETIGSMHAFYLGGHVMIHVGQLSAWRRVMGYGAV